MRNENSRAIVTGATGFVGSHIAHALVQKKSIEVHVSVRVGSNLWRLKDILHALHVHTVDLTDRSEVQQMISRVRPSTVYHLATFGGLPNETDSARIIATNLTATMHVLDAAMEFGANKFINTGSSSEYGISDHPMSETDRCDPITLYGITKLAAAHYCTSQAKLKQYAACTLRLFSPYGAFESPNRLYPTIVNALRGKYPPLLSRPTSVRDFIDIERVLQVYDKISTSGFEPGMILNVGSGQQQTIRDFYYRLARQMGIHDAPEPVWGEAPPRLMEPTSWVADTQKLRQMMGDDFF